MIIHEIDGTKNNVIMDVPLINMSGKDIFILSFRYCICKLISNLMGFLKADLSRFKGLYQVMG